MQLGNHPVGLRVYLYVRNMCAYFGTAKALAGPKPGPGHTADAAGAIRMVRRAAQRHEEPSAVIPPGGKPFAYATPNTTLFSACYPSAPGRLARHKGCTGGLS